MEDKIGTKWKAIVKGTFSDGGNAKSQSRN
jgi:hypothetical protein